MSSHRQQNNADFDTYINAISNSRIFTDLIQKNKQHRANDNNSLNNTTNFKYEHASEVANPSKNLEYNTYHNKTDSSLKYFDNVRQSMRN